MGERTKIFFYRPEKPFHYIALILILILMLENDEKMAIPPTFCVISLSQRLLNKPTVHIM
jgi:hypothetical protein